MARKLTLDFLKTEAGSGAVLGFAALAALIVANSPWSADYFAWLKSVQTVQIGPLRLEETVSDWIKEGLMAVFFLVVGLQAKFEVLKGELANPRRLALPLMAALGGMIVPALIFLAINRGADADPRGWPIAAATDLALALAALAAVARRLPSSLRLFLLTMALADNLAAVGLIGVHYTAQINLGDIAVASTTLVLLALMGRWRSAPFLFYAIGFVVVWAFTLHSGISTCVSAVACAMTVPTGSRRPGQDSVLVYFMDSLHPYVAFGVLPLYAFVAAGFSFSGLTGEELLAPLPLGLILAFVIGKPLGILGFTGLALALNLGKRPAGSTWLELAGVSLLCGVGFTMSLFIGGLALPGGGVVDSQIRLGVIVGSALCAASGVGLLALAERRRLAGPVRS